MQLIITAETSLSSFINDYHTFRRLFESSFGLHDHQATLKVAFGGKTPLFTKNKLLRSATFNPPSFFGITISGILRG